MVTRRMQWNNRLFLPLLLLVLTAVYTAATFQISPQVREGLVGPRFLPFLAACIMVVALARVIWNDLGQEGETRESAGILLPALVLLAMILYVVAFYWLGYVISTFLFVSALFHLFRFQEGRVIMRAVSAAAVTAIFYGMFALAFGVRLPTFMGVI